MDFLIIKVSVSQECSSDPHASRGSGVRTNPATHRMQNASTSILLSKGSSLPAFTAFFGGGGFEQRRGRQKHKQRSWYTCIFLSSAQCVCWACLTSVCVLGSLPHTVGQSLPQRGRKVTWHLKFGSTFYKRSSLVCVNIFFCLIMDCWFFSQLSCKCIKICVLYTAWLTVTWGIISFVWVLTLASLFFSSC